MSGGIILPERAPGAIDTPASGKIAIFPDSSASDALSYKDAAGTVHRLLDSAAIAAAYQPLDSDLTAIAALSTTSFGRSLLALADAAALAAANPRTFSLAIPIVVDG